MDWRSIDLNLLVVFQAMVDERSVTRAGEALGLSQPAMSAALSRLRELLGDTLFVRSGREMQPTPRALELAAPVRRVLDSISSDILQRAGFDPASAEKLFTIVTPDIGEVNIVPPLLGRLAQQAPRVTLRTIARTPQTTGPVLESGQAELALGHFPDLHKAGFFRQKLGTVPFVCLVSKRHPTIGERMTAEQFLSASHALVHPDGRGRDVDKWLSPTQAQRRTVVEVAHFMSLLPILENSDLIASVPRDIARICVRHAELRIVEMPMKAPTITIYLFWHQRFHKDPAHVWFRGEVFALCKELGY